MIQFVILFSKQAKTRLQKWYQGFPDKTKKKLLREVMTAVLSRGTKSCCFIEMRGLKLVYKRYASLYFCCAIEEGDNELLTLEIIYNYVEMRGCSEGNDAKFSFPLCNVYSQKLR